MTTIFDFDDYRAFFIEKRKESSHLRGFQTLMAEAAGCQRAYLSQVMHGHVQFTPDHALGLAEFFAFTRSEREYLLDLVNLERARTKQLKEWFRRRLKDQLQARKILSKRLDTPDQIRNHHEAEYYSRWYYAAIHMIVGIPKYRTVSAIAQKINLSKDTVSATLLSLLKMDMVEQQDGQWLRSQRDVHIAESQMMNSINHTNWRQKAIHDVQHDAEKSLHYTAVHSLSYRDIEEIKSIFVDAIARSRAVVAPSTDEELICVSCDIFTVV